MTRDDTSSEEVAAVLGYLAEGRSSAIAVLHNGPTIETDVRLLCKTREACEIDVPDPRILDDDAVRDFRVPS